MTREKFGWPIQCATFFLRPVNMLSTTITSWPCAQHHSPTHTMHEAKSNTRAATKTARVGHGGVFVTWLMRRSTRCDPTNPAPPVTSTRMRFDSGKVAVGG
jgi:hypothetical protein